MLLDILHTNKDHINALGTQYGAWPPYARHILDAAAKIRRVQARGDLTKDDTLYDAGFGNLQTRQMS